MLFFYFFSVFAEIIEQCELPSNSGLVFTKYYINSCIHCQSIAPLIDEIDSRVSRKNIPLKMHAVDCGKCECSKQNIETYPTLVISKDGVEVQRSSGYKEFDQIVDFIVKNTGLEDKVFKRRIKTTPGKVVQLKEADFYSGFDGPWLILFYYSKDDPLRGILDEVGKIYSGKLNVGEISASESANLVHRFNIRAYPTLLALYNGILITYEKKQDLPSLIEFSDDLLSKSFRDLSLSDFNSLASSTKSGDPIFVVFYSNLSLANSYFKRTAHEYKMRVKIYKSDDQSLFEKASIFPKKQKEDDENSARLKDEDMVVLTVYKNGIFHQCPSPLYDVKGISEWIFNSHFPHLVKITSDNFYTVFHGLKPAVVLLTKGDQFVNLLEKVSENRQIGLPFGDYVFGALEIDEFPLFIPSLLPGIEVPTVFIFNPMKQLFYHKKIKMNEDTFIDDIHGIIQKYEEDKLNVYPYRSKKLRNFLMLLVGSIIIGSLLMGKKMAKKND